MPSVKPITLADFYRQRNSRRGVDDLPENSSYLTNLQADASRPRTQRGGGESASFKANTPGLADYIASKKLQHYNEPIMSSDHPVSNEASMGGEAEAAEINNQANEAAAAQAAANAGVGVANASGYSDAATAIAIANDAYQGYNATQDDTLSKNQKIRQVRLNAGAGVVDYFTGGIGGQLAKGAHDWLEEKTGFSPGDISPSEYIAKKLFGSNTEKEKERIMKQVKKGTNIMAYDEANFKDMYLNRPGSHEKQLQENMAKYDIDENYQGFVKDETSPGGARWINNKFRSSKADETNLTPVDIWGGGAMYEDFGNRWSEVSEYQRYRVAREALKRGIADEHNGTVDIRETPEYREISEQILAGEAPADPEAEKEYNAWKAQENEAKGVSTPASPGSPDSGDSNEGDSGGGDKKEKAEDSGPATLPDPIVPPEQPVSTDENYVPIDAYKSAYTTMLKSMYGGAMKNYKNPYGGNYA